MMRATITVAVLLALAIQVPTSPTAARAASPSSVSGAQSLLMDPSVRAGGMGRASSAVFWGMEPNAWSNPALLPYNSGFRYERGRTQLIPDLANDVYYTSKRVTAAFAGIGFQIAGRPLDGVGGHQLDYGVAYATDVDGNVVGSFHSIEEIESFGAGINLLEASEHFLRAIGRDVPAVSRYGDVSVGWAEKKTRVDLAPASVTLDGIAGLGSTMTHDSGVLFRLTPYNSIDYPGSLPGLDRIASLRIDVSYGRSTLNYDDARISYIDHSQSDPVARIHRTGWAARAAIGFPSAARESMRRSGLGWLPDWISPLVQGGKAWDRELPMILDPATNSHLTGSTIRDEGWEVTFANIYSVRRGHIEDPDGFIIGDTSGWSVGLRWGNLAGFSYDEATVPQSIFLGPVHRKAVSFFVDPLQVWSKLRSRPMI